eukprot:6184075-Pleurochrysis_carterae.AAC.2
MHDAARTTSGWFLAYGLNHRAVSLADLVCLLSTGEASPSTRLRYGVNGAPTTLAVALPGLLLQDGLSRLGLPKNAGPREAKLKYRELSLALHPDKNQGQASQDEMARISACIPARTAVRPQNVGLGYVRDFFEAARTAGQLAMQDDADEREDADSELDRAVSSRKPREISHALDTVGRVATPEKVMYARGLLAQLDWEAKQEEERKSAEVLKQRAAEMQEARRNGPGEVANAPSPYASARSESSTGTGTEVMSELQKIASGLQLGTSHQKIRPSQQRTTPISYSSSGGSESSPTTKSASGTPTRFTNAPAAADAPADAVNTGFADFTTAVFPPSITPKATTSVAEAAALPHTAPAKAVPARAACGPAPAMVVGTPALDVTWEWTSDTYGMQTVWAAYVAPLNNLLEAAFAANGKSASLVIGDVPYTVDFERGVQRRLQPPFTERRVRRSVYGQVAAMSNSGASGRNNASTCMRRLFPSSDVSLDSQARSVLRRHNEVLF